MAHKSVDVTQLQGPLQDYLLQRFGCIRVARWAARETIHRLEGSPILELVGNPYLYAIGYGLSLALKYDAEPSLTSVSAPTSVLAS